MSAVVPAEPGIFVPPTPVPPAVPTPGLRIASAVEEPPAVPVAILEGIPSMSFVVASASLLPSSAVTAAVFGRFDLREAAAAACLAARAGGSSRTSSYSARIFEVSCVLCLMEKNPLGQFMSQPVSHIAVPFHFAYARLYKSLGRKCENIRGII